MTAHERIELRRLATAFEAGTAPDEARRIFRYAVRRLSSGAYHLELDGRAEEGRERDWDIVRSYAKLWGCCQRPAS